jgi:hypothetical protein
MWLTTKIDTFLISVDVVIASTTLWLIPAKAWG